MSEPPVKERRQSQWELQQQVNQIRRDMDEARKEVADNTAITVGIKRDIQELLDLFYSVKRTIKLLVVLGHFIKWAGGVGLVIWGCIFAWRHGTPPPGAGGE